MRKVIIIAVIIILAVGGLILRSHILRPKAPPPTTQQIWVASGIPVETSTIVRGDMEQTVETTGDITALNTASLSAKIAGRVRAVFVREGDQVSIGQTVAVLDQDDPMSNLQTAEASLASAVARLSQAKTNATVTKIETNSAIEQAQAMLNSAKSKLEVVKKPTRTQDRMVAENKVASTKADLDNAQANYQRNYSLVKEGAIAPSAFDVIKAQYLVAKANYKTAQDQLNMIVEGGRTEDISAAQSQVDVAREQLRAAKANASQNMLRQEDIKSAAAGVEQAKAAVAMAKQQLENTYIKSSISGQVATRTVDPGQVVSPGQSMITVVNLGSIYFKGDISEKQLGNVATGQRVRVLIDAFPGVPFEGKVVEMYPAGSTTSRNFSVRIAILGATQKIKPGMFARGNIVTDILHNTLLVPKDAIDERKGTQSVFTLSSNNTVKRHIVEVIRENRDFVEIQMPTDLKSGDVVATQGRQNLQDGAKVQAVNVNKVSL